MIHTQTMICIKYIIFDALDIFIKNIDRLNESQVTY